MEPQDNKKGFEATDVTFHSRMFRPTQKFEDSIKRNSDGSISGRVYGIPRLLMDPETKLIYLGYEFSPEVAKKFLDGTIVMPAGAPNIIDEETQKRMATAIKKQLKNSTRTWKK